MKLLTCSLAAFLLTGSIASAEVNVTIDNGRVTVVAKDATVRQIIAEWARVGQAKVVNAERLPGGPVTIELTNVPESIMLDTLLRSAAGYVAAPRPTMVAGLSTFDRVIVMPTSSAPKTTAAPAPPTFQQPQFAQPAVARRSGRRAAAAERADARRESPRAGVQHLSAAAASDQSANRTASDSRAAAGSESGPAADDAHGDADAVRAVWRRRGARHDCASAADAARSD